MALIPRGIEPELRDILSVSRAAAITGPRQAGKSTLAKQLQAAGVVPNYFTLDDEATRFAARADPDGFALSLPRPAVIDEIQRAPSLMLAVKQILDDNEFKQVLEGRPGFVIAPWCGSRECEAQIKTDTQATIRNMPIGGAAPSGHCVRCDTAAIAEAWFAKSY